MATEVKANEVDIRLLPQSRLRVDHQFQRQLDNNWVNWLYEHWDPNKVGILVVSSREDGDLIVLEGQHRLASLRLLLHNGQRINESLWSEVYFGLSLEEEADMFIGRNTRRNVHIIDKFKARRVAGEPVANAIWNALQTRKLHIDFKPANGYACVSVLEKVYSWGVLDQTLDLIETVWPNDTPAFRTAKHSRVIVEGVGLFFGFYHSNANFTYDRALRKAAERIKIIEVLKSIRNEALPTGTNQSVIFGRRLRDAYNHQASPQMRLPELIPPRGYRG